MSAHRNRNRTRGIGPLATLAREPFAAGLFYLATNPNRGKRGASALNHSERSLERIADIADVMRRNPEWHRVQVTIPRTDSLGRRNPRMTPRVTGDIN